MSEVHPLKNRLAHSVAAILLVGSATSAMAANPSNVPQPALVIDQQDVTTRTLTIFQSDLALLSEHIKLPSFMGPTTLEFFGVNPSIQPDTVTLDNLPAPLTLSYIRHNRNYQQVLRNAIGSEITLSRYNVANGTHEQRTPTLINVEHNGVLVQQDGQLQLIPFDSNWQILVRSTNSTNNRPYLRVQTDLGAPVKTTVLNYLAGGLSWAPSYQLMLNPESKKLALEARANLSNNSGADIPNTHLRLVAGTVYGGGNSIVMAKGPMMLEARAMSDSSAPMRMADSGYHLYRYNKRVSLPDQQTVQIPLSSLHDLPYSRQFSYVQHVSSGVQSESITSHPQQTIHFTLPNNDEHNEPLPAGSVQVYSRNSENELSYVGGNSINATAAGEAVSLPIGEAFDLSVEQTQTDFKQDNNDRITAYRIEIRNAGDKAHTVEVESRFNRSFELLKSSQKAQRGAGKLSWSVKVPAKGSTVIEYRARLNYKS